MVSHLLVEKAVQVGVLGGMPGGDMNAVRLALEEL